MPWLAPLLAVLAFAIGIATIRPPHYPDAALQTPSPAYGGNGSAKPHGQANTTHQQTTSDQREPPQSSALSQVLPSQKTNTEPTQDQTNGLQKALNDWGMLIFTGLSTFIFLAQLFVFGRQATRLKQTIEKMDEVAASQRADMQASIAQATRAADAAHSSTKIANDTLVVAQRAWVHVKPILAEPIIFNENGMRVTLRFDLTNTGETPALNFHINLEPFFRTHIRHDIASEQKRIADQAPSATANSLGAAIFPKEVRQQKVSTTAASSYIEESRIDFDGFRNDFIELFIIGAVTYRLAFLNEIHQTGFIYRISSLARDGMGPLGSLNIESGDIPVAQIVLEEWFVGAYIN